MPDGSAFAIATDQAGPSFTDRDNAGLQQGELCKIAGIQRQFATRDVPHHVGQWGVAPIDQILLNGSPIQPGAQKITFSPNCNCREEVWVVVMRPALATGMPRPVVAFAPENTALWLGMEKFG